MKKLKYVFALLSLLTISIYCSKSQDARFEKKPATAQTLAVGDSGCTCSDNDSSGSYTPTVTSFNISGVNAQKALFSKVKNKVTVDGRIIWQQANSTGQGALITISLPIQSPTPLVGGAAFGVANITELGGFVNQNGVNVYLPTLYTFRSFINQTPGTTMQITFNVQTTNSGGTIYYRFVYELVPAQ